MRRALHKVLSNGEPGFFFLSQTQSSGALTSFSRGRECSWNDDGLLQAYSAPVRLVPWLGKKLTE